MKTGKQALAWLFAALFLTASCGGLRHWRASDSFDDGLALFNRGSYEASIPYFERATEEDPNFAEAFLYLGRAHLSARHWREAIQPLRTAYRLAPSGTAKDKIFDILMDALLAAGLPPEPRSSERFRETL